MDGFLGEIRSFAFTFVPRGWLACNGALLPLQQYSALYSLLGTMYGGNGTTNFALPNYQGTAPIGSGQGPGLSSYSVGQFSGTESVSLMQNEMPAHNHIVHNRTVTATPQTVMTNVPTSLTNLSRQVSPTGAPQAAFYKGTNDQPTIMNPLTIGVTGGSGPHENRQPYLPLIVCVCTDGVYPARN